MIVKLVHEHWTVQYPCDESEHSQEKLLSHIIPEIKHEKAESVHAEKSPKPPLDVP